MSLYLQRAALAVGVALLAACSHATTSTNATSDTASGIIYVANGHPHQDDSYKVIQVTLPHDGPLAVGESASVVAILPEQTKGDIMHPQYLPEKRETFAGHVANAPLNAGLSVDFGSANGEQIEQVAEYHGTLVFTDTEGNQTTLVRKQ